MAAVSLIMQGAPCLMNDSMIFSLLDQSWYSRSILNSSIASVPGPSSVKCSAPSSAVAVELEQTPAAGIVRRQDSFDESEMRKVFNWFDENADGLISGNELRRWCTKCCGRDVSDAEADSMISSVDRNNDGAVDFEEFLSLYDTRRSTFDEQEYHPNALFDVEEEHEHEEADLLLEAFHVFDRNHDGFISAEELQAVLLNLGMPEGKSLISCKKMIRKVDRNGDGQCDIFEFQEMMSAQTLG